MFPQMRQTLTHHQHLTLNNQHLTPNSALNSSQGYHP